MKPRPAAILLVATLGALSLQAQSNKIIDTILAQPKAAYAETAYMALVGGGWLAESASPAEALALAQSKGWVAKNKGPEAPIDLGTFSALAMRGLRLRGGIAWAIFHSKRYAYRELVALGVVNASGGEKRVPSGEEVIRMIGKLSTSGGATK